MLHYSNRPGLPLSHHLCVYWGIGGGEGRWGSGWGKGGGGEEATGERGVGGRDGLDNQCYNRSGLPVSHNLYVLGLGRGWLK